MSWFSAPAYYAYVLGPDGNIQSRVDLYCDNDEEAERVIEQLLDRHAIELWQASRRIATYQPKNQGYENASLTRHLKNALQRAHFPLPEDSPQSDLTGPGYS